MLLRPPPPAPDWHAARQAPCSLARPGGRLALGAGLLGAIGASAALTGLTTLAPVAVLPLLAL